MLFRLSSSSVHFLCYRKQHCNLLICDSKHFCQGECKKIGILVMCLNRFCPSLQMVWIRIQLIMVIERRVVQFGLKSYVWFQNRKSAQREFDLNSQVWFQTKIARPNVQLPLYYIHFEIAQFNSQICQINNGCFVFHFPAMWLVSLKKLLSLIGSFVLLFHSHWLRKRCNLEQTIVQFVNKSHRWEPITLQG